MNKSLMLFVAKLCVPVCMVVFMSTQAQAFEKIQEVRGASGLTAWLMEDHRLPVVSVRGAIRRAGSAYAPEGQDGVAMMAAGLLTEGAGSMDYQQFQTALDADGIKMGFEAGVDDIEFALQTVSEHRERAFGLLGLAMGSPRMDVSAVERLRRDVLAQQALMQAKPEYVADIAFRKAAFEAHPYARSGDGDAKSISDLDASEIKQFAHDHIAQDRLVLAVAGDVTAEQLRNILDQLAQALPKQAQASHEQVAEVSMSAQGRGVTKRLDVPQTAVVFGLPAIKRDHPDFYAAYVMNYIMGGEGLGSRLAKSIREDAGLSYYVNTGLELNDASGVLRGAFASRTDQVDQAVKLLKHELVRAHDQGFTQKELDAAKTYITGSFPLALDSSKNIAKYMLSMQMQGLGVDYLEHRNGFIQSVTLEQLNAVAAKILDVNALLLVQVGRVSSSETVVRQEK